MVIGVSSKEMDVVINGGQLLRGLTPEIICFLVMKMVNAIIIRKTVVTLTGHTSLNMGGTNSTDIIDLR